MQAPLYVAFVWHMHQPLYRDTATGQYSLPWVRLHATKDYLHMAEVLAEYPRVHATFNVVPSLIEQLEDYGRGMAEDRALAVSRQTAWSAADREYLLDFFYSINWDRFVRRYPGYAHLLELRDLARAEKDYISTAFFRDLVAWFNLAWIDPGYIARDPELSALVTQGRGFSRRQIDLILDKQIEIINRIVPTYRELQARGQIELTTSPYYHPILPLLIDSRVALEASPQLPLPATLFAHPEDAREQLRQAFASHQATFGQRPQGLWPSEGSVSQATVEILAQMDGLRWIASDEGILARSLGVWIERDGYGHVLNPDLLYQPYRLSAGDLTIIFRDRVLSDRIGFVYKQMSGPDAAADLLGRLHHIRDVVKADRRPHLVSIILDGENCWEEYADNGDPFLHALYQGLSHDPDLRAVTVSEYLAEHPAQQRIERLAAGSWINQNLETWIGEPAQNQAWAYLARVRDQLIAWQRENPLLDLGTLEQAWREIYVAEGSDWFWWYYSHNRLPGENQFDREFHRHLGNVYRLLGLPAPGWLQQPTPLQGQPQRPAPRGFIKPPLDAAAQPSAEWALAGYEEAQTEGGSMQRGGAVLRGLHYGYDQDHLYLRLEGVQSLEPFSIEVVFALPISEQGNHLPQAVLDSTGLEWPSLSFHRTLRVEGHGAYLLRAAGQEIWEPIGPVPLARSMNVIETSVPLADLGVHRGAWLSLIVVLARDGIAAELLPASGQLTFTLESFA